MRISSAWSLRRTVTAGFSPRRTTARHWRTSRTFVSRLRAQHLRVRYPSASSYYGVVSAAAVNGDARTGTVTVCGVDGGVLYDQRDPANPDDDVVVNDELTSSRDIWSMRLIDGRWKRVGFRNLSTWNGVNRCPARPAH